MIKKFEFLPSLDQDVFTLGNIDLNSNVGDDDSNIDGSKKEELRLSLNASSDGKFNEEDNGDTFLEKTSDEPIFKVAELLNGIAELLNGRLKGYFVSCNVFNLLHRKLSKAEVSLLSKGLKFCPTPINKSVLKKDWKN